MLPVALPAIAAAALAGAQANPPKLPLEIVGMTVVPHNRAPRTRFTADDKKTTGALVHLFVRNQSKDQTIVTNETWFDGKYPLRLVMEGLWAWHDTPARWGASNATLPPGAMAVWSFNSRTAPWKPGHTFQLRVEDWERGTDIRTVTLPKQDIGMSAVTFLGSEIRPNRVVVHVRNSGKSAIQLKGLSIHTPSDPKRYRQFTRTIRPTNIQTHPADGIVPAGDTGILTAETTPLPLGYGVVETTIARGNATESLWARLRIKREAFDISGGWVNDDGIPGPSSALKREPFLKLLKRQHIDTAHLGPTPGYTDQTGPNGLFTQYPLKTFGSLTPIEEWDTDSRLPLIHGVDAVGEPQFGGGSGQRLPQEVLIALEHYAPTRLPTTLTLSDESTWAAYAGLSDFPHYDAYRVTAPSPDPWAEYDRWGSPRIAWGSPLETIGDMSRSLRELSRPMPTAYWGQTAHSGWDVYDGRERTTPTPDEILLQAYHALSSRITSFYWFNPSLYSQVLWRDTIVPMERIGREMRLLESFYLEGDSTHYREVRKADNRLDWDLSVITAPHGALCFALDLDYAPDHAKKVFTFGKPRAASFAFPLPKHQQNPVDVFRIDADGAHAVRWTARGTGIVVDDTPDKVGIYVATRDKNLRAKLETRRRELIARENATGFDPGRNDADFALLKSLTGAK